MEIVRHGIDVIEIAAFAKLIDDPGGDFIERCFTEDERSDVQTFSDRTQRLAGKFAAKEAVVKALGTGFDGTVSPCEIEVSNRPNGEPFVALLGTAAEIAAGLRISQWQVSISHCAVVAVASVIAVGHRTEG